MNPANIPFNVLVAGPTNSGKSQFVVDQLYGPFRGKFDYMVLIYPTFAHNKTFRRLGKKDSRIFIVICDQHEVELWLKVAKFLLEGTNTLIVLDDCAASKDVKGLTGDLASLAFSARYMGISVWALTQKYTSIMASFRENVAAVVLFYTPAAKTMKSIYEDFSSELTPEEYKALIARLKKSKVLVPSSSRCGTLSESNSLTGLSPLSPTRGLCPLPPPSGDSRRRRVGGGQLKISNQNIATADDAQVLADVMNLLEEEPNPCDLGVVESVTQGPDMPAMREQLAVLVSTGKAKEAIGVTLTHEDVKRLTDKDVEKYSKRYQTFIGSKTTESLIDSMIDLYAYGGSAVLNIKDVDRLKEDLKKDFTISKELTVVAGNLALKFGSFLALANTALITRKHVTFAQQSPTLPQQSPAIAEHSAAI